MMRIQLPEGTHLTGSAEIIVRIMRDAHWTAGGGTVQDFMEQVSRDSWRLHGAAIRADNPERFLRSLAQYNLIKIEEAA